MTSWEDVVVVLALVDLGTGRARGMVAPIRWLLNPLALALGAHPSG